MDPETLIKVLPSPIQPYTYKGKAFLSIVISDLEKMRPSFLPKLLGTDYNQIVYRAVVTLNEKPGVYFVRSDSDSRFLNLMGNIFSNFKLSHAHIDFQESSFSLKSKDTANIKANYQILENKDLPDGSIFSSFKDATKHLVELYSAFSIREGNGYEVQIKRGNWDCKVVKDNIAQYDFMQKGDFFNSDNCEIDSIFYIENVDYKWYTQNKLDSKPLRRF